MENLDNLLREVGFSDELINAIGTIPQLESQDIDVDNIRYQTFESNMVSSTEINMNENPSTYNYYGNETK